VVFQVVEAEEDLEMRVVQANSHDVKIMERESDGFQEVAMGVEAHL